MAGRSATAAGLISGEDMAARLPRRCEERKRRSNDDDSVAIPKTKAPARWPGLGAFSSLRRSVALSEELQEQREQVDEVQVERQRAGDRRAFRHVTAGRGVAVDVLVLQPLGIPGGEAREHHDADD